MRTAEGQCRDLGSQKGARREMPGEFQEIKSVKTWKVQAVQ